MIKKYFYYRQLIMKIIHDKVFLLSMIHLTNESINLAIVLNMFIVYHHSTFNISLYMTLKTAVL